MAEINWGLAQQQPDIFGNALNAFSAGQKQRSSTNRRNALAMYGKDPDGAIDALRTEDPEMAFGLEDRREKQRATQTRKDVLSQAGTDVGGAQKAALATGDTDLINTVSQMSAQQKAAAAKATEEVSTVAYALRNSPYEERKKALPQLAPYLKERGYTDEMLAGFDPTDANLDTVIAQGATLLDLMKQRDQQADNARADEKAKEDARHNREMERIGGTKASASMISANRPRAGGGAASTTLPPGYAPVGR